jgi:hypothetical protein
MTAKNREDKTVNKRGLILSNNLKKSHRPYNPQRRECNVPYSCLTILTLIMSKHYYLFKVYTNRWKGLAD